MFGKNQQKPVSARTV